MSSVTQILTTKLHLDSLARVLQGMRQLDVSVPGAVNALCTLLFCLNSMLADWSKIFHAMFTHDMTEKKTGRVEIKDFSAGVILTALKMMYNGYSNQHPAKDYKHLLELARFGDKYCIEELVSACTKSLYLETNVLNVVDNLVHVENVNFELKELREQLITYIAMLVQYLEISDA